MAAEDLLVRASLQNDLSAPLAGVRRDVDRTARSIRHAGEEGRRMGRGTGDAERAMTSLGRRMRDVDGDTRRLSDRLSSGLMRAVRTVTIGIAAAGLAVGGFGLKTAASLETGRVALEATTGSAREAGAVFEFLRRLDPLAPFDIGQLQGAATTLANFDLSGQQLQRTLQGVVDVASGSADPTAAFDRIAIAVGQIHASGALLTQDLNQLIQAGAPVGRALQEAFGMTLAEFRRAQESGSLGLNPDLFLETLFGIRAGTAEQVATGTLTGLLSGVRSRVMLALSSESSPLLESIKEQLPTIEAGVGTLLDKLGPPLVELGGTLLNLFVTLLPAAAPVIGAIANGLASLLAAGDPEKLGNALAELAPAITAMFERLAPLMPALVDAFVTFVGLLPDLLLLFTGLVAFAVPVLTLVTNLLELDGVREVAVLLLAVLFGYSKLAGVIQTLYTFAAAIRAIGTAQAFTSAQGTVGAVPGVAGAAGRAGPGGTTVAGGGGRAMAGLGAVLGVAATGAQVAERAGSDRRHSFGEDLGLVGTTALTGAALGSFFPVVGTGLGALAGGAVGAGIAAWDAIWGSDDDGPDPRRAPRSRHSGEAALAGGGTQVNTVVESGAIVVYPTSNIDLEQALPAGIEAYSRSQSERGAGD